MKTIRNIFACILTAVTICTVSSCSKDNNEGNPDPIGIVTIDGTDLTIAEAGYTVLSGYTIIQFIIDDPGGQNGASNIELQFPDSYTGGEWYILAQDGTPASSWRIILQNTLVGNGVAGAMDYIIREGSKVLIHRLGELNKSGKCKYRIAFDITLTDGKTARMDIVHGFKKGTLWVGGDRPF